MGYDKPSTKLTFYKAFFSSQWKFLIHTILQCMSAKRTSWNEFSSSMASAVICLSTGKGCSRVETPLFEGMIVAPQAGEGAAEGNVDDIPAAGVAIEGVASVNVDDVLTAIVEPSIPSPTPSTQSPPPSQDIPFTSQVQHTPPPSLIAQLPSPQQQPQPSQDADISMDLLHNLLDTCTTLTRRGRIIADMDADVDVTLKDIARDVAVDAEIEENVNVTLKDIAKDVAVDVEIEESADVQGRQA
nr:hypothetical protein [Tanacetum cinerariifolium]